MWKQSFHSLQWHLPFPEGIIAPAWANLLFANACTVSIDLTSALLVIALHGYNYRDVVLRRIPAELPYGSSMRDSASDVLTRSQ